MHLVQFNKGFLYVTRHIVSNSVAPEGVRDRKRRETRRRIAETGLKLFLEQGYEGTTLDAIAAEAGISRRTFFLYFKSKDEIVMAWQENAWEEMLACLLTVSPDEAPLDAVRKTLVSHVLQYESGQMKAIDRVMRASKILMARKQATYAIQEDALYATLCEVWRQPQRRASLRIVAMVSIGTMRIAIEAWGQQTDGRGIGEFLEEEFERLKAEI